jgi:hypothetical protein
LGVNSEGRKTKDARQNTQHTARNARHAVELRIEELVLDGFAAYDRYRIGAAMEAEMTRLLAEQGVPLSLARDGEIARLDGGAFEMAAHSRAEVIGAQVARALYGGLNR